MCGFYMSTKLGNFELFNFEVVEVRVFSPDIIKYSSVRTTVLYELSTPNFPHYLRGRGGARQV